MHHQTQETCPPVNVGVIGAGIAGAMHIDTLNFNVPDLNVVAIADIDVGRASSLASRCHGHTKVLRDAKALIHDPSVDAVVVTSIASTHAELVTECIKAGKHVFCEKPLAVTAADCKAIAELEQSHGRRLVQLGFMRRFDPYYLDLKDNIGDSAIGELVAVHAVHRTNFLPDGYTSEMLVTEALIHEIDVLRWLLEDEFRAVSVASSESTSTPGLRDPQFVQLTTMSDVHIDIEVFVGGKTGYQVECEVVGTEGIASLAGPSVTQIKHQGIQGTKSQSDFRARFQEAYRIEMLQWACAVRGENSTGPSSWDGYAAAVVTDSVLAALSSGNSEAVDVPTPPEFYMA